MKQLIQNYKTGELQLVEVSDPLLRQNGIILQTANSLISVGTEKLMISLAQKGYLGKALARPDLVKQVVNKIQTDGIFDAYKAVMSRLDAPVPLGYSSAGIIREVGKDIHGFTAENRIACFGDLFATHSELSFVPKNMFVKIPDNVSFESAAFVGLGAIALNAIRVVNLTFGENVAVIGLGLLGQLTVQMLKAFGCKVLGIDISNSKLEMAKDFGADACGLIGRDDILQMALDFTNGVGADAVIIMAGAQDNKPIEMAAEISRDQGRIIACGMVSLDVPRQEFFKKELRVIVSRATGPGKFDPLYESKGIDYPLPYVRWTTQRNMACFLDLVSQGKVNVQKLITHRFKIEKALDAYDMILNNKEPYLGVLLEYGEKSETIKRIDLRPKTSHPSSFVLRFSSLVPRPSSIIGVGLIGAGLHANTDLLPTLKKFNKEIKLVGIANSSGFKGRHAGIKYGFEYCVSDYKELLDDKNINAVIIATRHNLHFQMVVDSLNAGKHVFVEKPLCINEAELIELSSRFTIHDSRSPIHDSQILMVGFNRRYSPFAIKAKELLSDCSNAVINVRVNAGFVQKESWIHDEEEGGGRIIGEVCHFVDLLQYLTSSLVSEVYARATAKNEADNLVITLKMVNGAIATILYSSQGNKLLPRERIEVFSKSSVCVLDNFKSLFFARQGKIVKKGAFGVDRGFNNEFRAFFDAIKSVVMPVSFDEYANTTLTTFKIIESLKQNRPVEI